MPDEAKHTEGCPIMHVMHNAMRITSERGKKVLERAADADDAGTLRSESVTTKVSKLPSQSGESATRK